jgi:hypothetical protein
VSGLFPAPDVYPSSTTYPHAKEPIPYRNITVSYGTELLYNRAVVSNIGGQPQARENAASIAEYGVSSLEVNGLLIPTESIAADFAEYFVNIYGEPELRIDSISVQLSGLFMYQQNQILDLELSDMIRVRFAPNGIGDPIVQDLRVLGVAHDIRPASHEVRLALASAGDINFVFAGAEDPSAFPFSIFAGTLGGTAYPGSPLGL